MFGDRRPQIHRVSQHVRPCLLYSDVYSYSEITCFGSSLQTSVESLMVFQGDCSNLKTMIGVCKRSMVVSPKILNWETSQCSLAANSQNGTSKKKRVWMINGEIFLLAKKSMKAPNL